MAEFVNLEHAELSLTLSMEIDPVIIEGGQWLAKFEIRNNGPIAVSFLPWGTPWEGALTRSLFKLEAASGIVEYTGPMIKRRAPMAADYIEIKPGASRLIELDISKAYNLENRENEVNYSLTYLSSSLAIISQGQEFVVTVPELATINLRVEP